MGAGSGSGFGSCGAVGTIGAGAGATAGVGFDRRTVGRGGTAGALLTAGSGVLGMTGIDTGDFG